MILLFLLLLFLLKLLVLGHSWGQSSIPMYPVVVFNRILPSVAPVAIILLMQLFCLSGQCSCFWILCLQVISACPWQPPPPPPLLLYSRCCQGSSDLSIPIYDWVHSWKRVLESLGHVPSAFHTKLFFFLFYQCWHQHYTNKSHTSELQWWFLHRWKYFFLTCNNLLIIKVQIKSNPLPSCSRWELAKPSLGR